MSDKTESIVRGWANGYDLQHPQAGVYIEPAGDPHHIPSHMRPATILLHGPNGEVGGLRPEMLLPLEKRVAYLTDEMAKYNGTARVALEEIRDMYVEIATAIARILATGGEG